MSETIKKLLVEDILNKFYNYHLNEAVSAWINIKIFEGKDPKEKVGERVTPSPVKNQVPFRVEVNAGEALNREVQRFNNQRNVLIVIERRLADVKKLKNDSEIWRNK